MYQIRPTELSLFPISAKNQNNKTKEWQSKDAAAKVTLSSIFNGTLSSVV